MLNRVLKQRRVRQAQRVECLVYLVIYKPRMLIIGSSEVDSWHQNEVRRAFLLLSVSPTRVLLCWNSRAMPRASRSLAVTAENADPNAAAAAAPVPKKRAASKISADGTCYPIACD